MRCWCSTPTAGRVYTLSTFLQSLQAPPRSRQVEHRRVFPPATERLTTLAQLAFEKKLHAKSIASTEPDVLMLEGSLAVYAMGTDLYIYVVGSTGENEIVLMLVLEAFLGTLKTVLRGHLDKHTILDNLELLLLTVDEIVDAGTVLETDSTVLAKRVMLRNADGSSASPAVAIANPSELTLASAFSIAREGLARFTRS
jgi:hypothetical protein